MSDTVVEPYNATLSINQLVENTDETYIIGELNTQYLDTRLYFWFSVFSFQTMRPSTTFASGLSN